MTLRPVLLIRPSDNDVDREALSERGIPSLECPLLRVSTVADPSGARVLLDHVTPGAWVVAASGNAIRSWAELVGADSLRLALSTGVEFAAVGESSARALGSVGARDVVIPSLTNAAALANELVERQAVGVAIIPKGNLAMSTLPAVLETNGWRVFSEVVYTITEIDDEPPILGRVADGEFSAVVVRSPSAARAMARWIDTTSLPVVCAGETTAAAVRQIGFPVAAIARSSRPADVADAVHMVVTRVESR